MRMSDKGLAELAGHEGIVTSWYDDSKGIATVGVGHTAAAGVPDPKTVRSPMPVADLMALFRRDVARYEAAVTKALQVPVSQTQFDALVSFHYNTGAIARATLTKKLNAGDVTGAADAFMGWVKPAEIKERRQKEQRLFRHGVYANGGMATIYPADAKGRVQWSKGERVNALALMAAHPGAEPAPASSAPVTARPSGDLVRKVQQLLRDRGYPEVGNVDGKMGDRTRDAILVFQANNALTIDGLVSDALLAELVKAPQRRVAPERAEATAKTLKDAPAIQQGQALKTGGIGAVVIGAAGSVLNGTTSVDDIVGHITTGKLIWSALGAAAPWAALAVGGGLAVWFGARFVREQVEAYRAGRHV